jgi:hypothetical protein
VADGMSHARHDRLAVAAAIGGAILPPTVRTCPSCGALHGDLLTLREALRMAWTLSRPRDFLLTTGDVARLRPTRWRRLSGLIGSSRDAVTGPLAVGFTGIGIIGLLLTGIPLVDDGAAGGSAPPVEIMSATEPSGTPAVDRHVAADTNGPDQLVIVSVGSIALGGSLFALRRVASRSSRVR